jgi:hypothetical protein
MHMSERGSRQIAVLTMALQVRANRLQSELAAGWNLIVIALTIVLVLASSLFAPNGFLATWSNVANLYGRWSREFVSVSIIFMIILALPFCLFAWGETKVISTMGGRSALPLLLPMRQLEAGMHLSDAVFDLHLAALAKDYGRNRSGGGTEAPDGNRTG